MNEMFERDPEPAAVSSTGAVSTVSPTLDQQQRGSLSQMSAFAEGDATPKLLRPSMSLPRPPDVSKTLRQRDRRAPLPTGTYVKYVTYPSPVTNLGTSLVKYVNNLGRVPRRERVRDATASPFLVPLLRTLLGSSPRGV